MSKILIFGKDSVTFHLFFCCFGQVGGLSLKKGTKRGPNLIKKSPKRDLINHTVFFFLKASLSHCRIEFCFRTLVHFKLKVMVTIHISSCIILPDILSHESGVVLDMDCSPVLSSGSSYFTGLLYVFKQPSANSHIPFYNI